MFCQFGHHMISCVLILAAVGDLSNYSASADGDGEFADFASFQPTSLPQLTTQPHVVYGTETNDEMTTAGLSSYQPPPFTSSLSSSDNTPTAVSGREVSDKYQMIKQLISDPALFTSGPRPASALAEEGVNSDWSEFQEPPSVRPGGQSTFSADFCATSAPDDGEWADFRSSLAAGASHSQDVVPSYLPDADREDRPGRTKSSTVGWFGVPQSHPSHALFSSGAMDFCPPELPPDNDDDDANDVGYHPVLGGDSSQGISSLSTLDLEDESVDAVGNGGGLLKAGVRGMTASNSTSSFEFTGWQLGSKHSLPVPPADAQSTSSLDLRPTTEPSGRSPANYSPSQPTAEPDSQSENSFEFVPPTSENRIPGLGGGILGAEPDRLSLQSLELTSTLVSAEEESSSGVGRDDAVQVTCQSLGGRDGSTTHSGMSVTKFKRNLS